MPLPPLPGPAPLSELNADTSNVLGVSGYNFSSLKYPEDISISSYQGHYVNFYINVHAFSNYVSGGNYSYKSVFNGTKTYQTTTANPIPSSSLGSSLQKRFYKRITQAISLYIPDTMNTSESIQWENSSLKEYGATMARGLGGVASMFSQADKLSGASKNTMRSVSSVLEAAGATGNVSGFAINPQLLVIFKGLEPRSFAYEFYFTPKNEKEAQSIRSIVEAFRFHSHPELWDSYGAFFVAPSTFDIQFMHKGKINNNIHQIKTCVLKSVNVDYAPFSWSTYVDGMPVQTKLALQFQEADIITKQDIEKGY